MISTKKDSRAWRVAVLFLSERDITAGKGLPAPMARERIFPTGKQAAENLRAEGTVCMCTLLHNRWPASAYPPAPGQANQPAATDPRRKQSPPRCGKSRHTKAVLLHSGTSYIPLPVWQGLSPAMPASFSPPVEKAGKPAKNYDRYYSCNGAPVQTKPHRHSEWPPGHIRFPNFQSFFFATQPPSRNYARR